MHREQDMTSSQLSIASLSLQTFDRFRELIYEKTNINMRESKQILLSNRLRKRIVALGLQSYDEYYRYITESRDRNEELVRFIDAVSTNETYFFREMNHFNVLRETILPELFKSKKKIRIWSAGCSTGEEAYTLRMVVDETKGTHPEREAQIVATDISTEVVETARRGLYRQRSFRSTPPEIVERYFLNLGNGLFQVKESLRRQVDFRVHNLLKEAPPEKHFEVIFCRNVMIYFDKKTQRKLADEHFAEVLDPRGYLCIGHSESLTGTSQRFRYLRGLKAPVYQTIEE
jgi:chemotaxis protein methyltransferase CheR